MFAGTLLHWFLVKRVQLTNHFAIIRQVKALLAGGKICVALFSDFTYSRPNGIGFAAQRSAALFCPALGISSLQFVDRNFRF